MTSKKRPSWPEYFERIAEFAATRSQCHARQVGAVIVQEKHIIATGYNGVPTGIEPCQHCHRQAYEPGKGYAVCPANHAEANAIAQAAKLGVSTAGASIYCTYAPCKDCVGLLINAGIYMVFSPLLKKGSLAKELLDESKIIKGVID